MFNWDSIILLYIFLVRRKEGLESKPKQAKCGCGHFHFFFKLINLLV